jgi:hypothetical protein
MNLPAKQIYNAPDSFSEAGGIISMLDSLGDILRSSVNGIIITAAIIIFVWSVASYIWKLRDGKADENDRKRMVWGIVLLTVLFSIYGLIRLSVQIFGLQGADNGTGRSGRGLNTIKI